VVLVFLFSFHSRPSPLVTVHFVAGTQETESATKKGYKVPRVPMANTDLARVINSDEIQSVVNAPKKVSLGKTMKKNPLKNLGAMLKLNPYVKTIRRNELANQARSALSGHACRHHSAVLHPSRQGAFFLPVRLPRVKGGSDTW
jgi:hypothetical protein